MSNIKVIVGLGNPKLKYQSTRHNVGAWFIELLSKHCNIELRNTSKFFGSIGQYKFNNINIWLLQPHTFMNLSGLSVFSFSSFYNIDLHQILFIHDDLDVPPGIIKLKFGYGHNGHNGLRNIIDKFGNCGINFCRIRIGIGRPNNSHEIKSFVLSPPLLSEKNAIIKVIKHVMNDINYLIIKKKPFINSKIYNIH